MALRTAREVAEKTGGYLLATFATPISVRETQTMN